ncbi:MAG TPA: DUF3826 domain-containing protein [Verrucomicrobiae bacterium]|jgi:hypothetical protein
MKKILFLLITLCAAVPVFAAKEKPADTNESPAQVEADYTKAIEGRTANILKALDLTDTNKIAYVHDTVMAQWRGLRAWHDANDSKIKAAGTDTNAVAQIQVSLRQMHAAFIAKLSQDLTPEQVEIVKDKMTYGVVQATYNGYLQIVPNLTDTDKVKIMELLKDGREEAMDGGSQKEKAAIIKKYKGRINIYLDAHGHNVSQAYKDWGAAQKAKAKAAADEDTNATAN